MALNPCPADPWTATRRSMQGEPWQIRLKEAKITQRALGRLLGKPENTISRQLRGEFGEVPDYLVAIIVALEQMDDDQRADWIKAVEKERT